MTCLYIIIIKIQVLNMPENFNYINETTYNGFNKTNQS